VKIAFIGGGNMATALIGGMLARGRADEETPLSLGDAPRIILLFHLVCLLWVFFRAETFWWSPVFPASSVLVRPKIIWQCVLNCS